MNRAEKLTRIADAGRAAAPGVGAKITTKMHAVSFFGVAPEQYDALASAVRSATTRAQIAPRGATGIVIVRVVEY